MLASTFNKDKSSSRYLVSMSKFRSSTRGAQAAADGRLIAIILILINLMSWSFESCSINLSRRSCSDKQPADNITVQSQDWVLSAILRLKDEILRFLNA